MEPLIAPVLDFVCPSSWVSNLACTLSCLRAVILKVTTNFSYLKWVPDWDCGTRTSGGSRISGYAYTTRLWLILQDWSFYWSFLLGPSGGAGQVAHGLEEAWVRWLTVWGERA